MSDADFFEAVKTGELHCVALCVLTPSVCVGQAERVEEMLSECPALVNAKTKDGVTPLMRAANKGHVKVGFTLLSLSHTHSLSLRCVRSCSQLVVQ